VTQTQIQDLLHATLAAQATYSEKQLLKAGEITQCAEQVLQRRRRSVRIHGWVFLAIISIPIVIQVATVLFAPSIVTKGFAYGQFSIFALIQIPSLIELRISQTRIETLIALWLLAENHENDSLTTSLASQLFDAL